MEALRFSLTVYTAFYTESLSRVCEVFISGMVTVLGVCFYLFLKQIICIIFFLFEILSICLLFQNAHKVVLLFLFILRCPEVHWIVFIGCTGHFYHAWKSVQWRGPRMLNTLEKFTLKSYLHCLVCKNKSRASFKTCSFNIRKLISVMFWWDSLQNGQKN